MAMRRDIVIAGFEIRRGNRIASEKGKLVPGDQPVDLLRRDVGRIEPAEAVDLADAQRSRSGKRQ